MLQAKGGAPTGHLKKLVRGGREQLQITSLRTCAVFGEIDTQQDERWNADGVLAVKCCSPWVAPASRAALQLSRALSSTDFSASFRVLSQQLAVWDSHHCHSVSYL